MRCFYWSVLSSKWQQCYESCARSGPKKLTKTYDKGVNQSTLIAMAKQVKQVHIFLLLKCQIFAGGVLRCLDPVVL